MYSLLVSCFGWLPGDVAQLTFISCNKRTYTMALVHTRDVDLASDLSLDGPRNACLAKKIFSLSWFTGSARFSADHEENNKGAYLIRNGAPALPLAE